MNLIAKAIQDAKSRGELPEDMTAAERDTLARGLAEIAQAGSLLIHATALADVARITQGGESRAATDMEILRVLTSWEHEAIASNGILRDLIKKTKKVSRTLASRISGMLHNLKAQATGFSQKVIGNTKKRLRDYPAWELVRVEPREVPRGSPGSHSLGWPERWHQCGFPLIKGRMIAAKGSEVWDKLGDPEIFEDAIGKNYPPLAWGSGMGWAERSRKACIELGVDLA